MLTIQEARKELKRVGTSHAEGDALRFMYANMLAFEHRMSVDPLNTKWPVNCLYEHLQGTPDGEIRTEYKRLSHSRPATLKVLGYADSRNDVEER